MSPLRSLGVLAGVAFVCAILVSVSAVTLRPFQERNQILRSCLSELSPAHREIIDLVYYHERSIEEVSEIIGVPANTVKTRMFYARKRIGEMMASRGIERYAI